MAFLAVNNFFCAFSKILTKRTFVRLLFLKLIQSRNTKKKILEGFSSKTKNALWLSCSGARLAPALKIWIWTSKIIPDLWLVNLFWPIKKKFHTPPKCASSVHAAKFSFSKKSQRPWKWFFFFTSRNLTFT